MEHKKMAMIRTIQIRLSREQYNKIKADAFAFGINSLSGYLRYLALARNTILEKQIQEIYKKVMGKTRKKKLRIGSSYPFVEY